MKLHKVLIFAAAFVVAASSGVASAQGQGGQRPGGQQGQGGGMRMGRGASGLMLLMLPDVQKELNITAQQKASIEKSLSGMMPGAGGQGGGQGQRPNFEEMEKKVLATFNAAQKTRYEELKLQAAGPNAFRRDDVQKKLGITETQKSAIDKSLEKARPNFNRQQGQQVDFDKLRKEMQAKRDTAMKEIMALLNANQKATWGKMTGKPFKFPQMQMRGPGGGRPGGGRGG